MSSLHSLRAILTTNPDSRSTSCREHQWVDGQFRETSRVSRCFSVVLLRTTLQGLGCLSMEDSMVDKSFVVKPTAISVAHLLLSSWITCQAKKSINFPPVLCYIQDLFKRFVSFSKFLGSKAAISLMDLLS